MNTNLTDITIVLDRSGSMASVRDATIEAVNGYVASQSNAPGECRLTFVQFDDQYQVDHNGIDIKAFPPLTQSTYQPRASTALLDAIGKTIISNGNRFSALDESQRPGTVIFVIQTDGFENASREFTKHRINELISEHRDKWNWQFVFLGADQDAIATAAQFGIDRSQALTYGKSDEGTQQAFEQLTSGSLNVRSARASGNMNAKYAFDESKRSSAMK